MKSQTLLAISIALINIPAMNFAMENTPNLSNVVTKSTEEGTISLRSTDKTDTYTQTEPATVITAIFDKQRNCFSGHDCDIEQFDDGQFAPERRNFEPQEAAAKFTALQNLFNKTRAQ